MSLFSETPKSKQIFPVLLLPGSGKFNSTIFVLGSTGCGKTTLIANLLLRVPQGRFVIFDTKCEYFPEFFGGDTVTVNNLKDFAVRLNSGCSKIIYRLESFDLAEDHLSAACLQLMDFQKVNDRVPMTIALDELNRFVNVMHSPVGIQEIVQRGRGRNIQKIFGAQWFGVVPTWMRDSFSELYIFRHNDRAGLSLLASYGFDIEQVQTLPPYTCLYSNGGTIRKITLVATNQTS